MFTFLLSYRLHPLFPGSINVQMAHTLLLTLVHALGQVLMAPVKIMLAKMSALTAALGQVEALWPSWLVHWPPYPPISGPAQLFPSC